MRLPALLLTCLLPTLLHAGEESEPASEATPAKVRRPLMAERYLGLFAGNLKADSDDVTASTQCFFCAPVSATHTVNYNSGKMTGLRGGFWAGSGPVQGGLMFELARGDVEGDLAEASFTAFNFAPALRVRVRQPLDRLQVHAFGGLVLGKVRDGEARVNFPEFSNTATGPVEGSSSGMLAGISLTYGPLVLTTETRRVSTNLKFHYLGDNGELKLACKQTLVSAGWKF